MCYLYGQYIMKYIVSLAFKTFFESKHIERGKLLCAVEVAVVYVYCIDFAASSPQLHKSTQATTFLSFQG